MRNMCNYMLFVLLLSTLFIACSCLLFVPFVYCFSRFVYCTAITVMIWLLWFFIVFIFIALDNTKIRWCWKFLKLQYLLADTLLFLSAMILCLTSCRSITYPRNIVSCLEEDQEYHCTPLSKRQKNLCSQLEYGRGLYSVDLKGHFGCVNAIAFSRNGEEFLASGKWALDLNCWFFCFNVRQNLQYLSEKHDLLVKKIECH